MSGRLMDLAGTWQAWIVSASVQVAVLGVVVWAFDLLAGRKVWQEVRTALWTAVLLRILIPPHLAAFEVMPAAAVPAVALDSTGAGLPVAGTLGAWLLGVTACAALGFRQARVLGRWLRDETAPVEDGEGLTVLRDVARRLGLRRLPELRVGPRSAIPAAFGFRRHAIVVPATLLQSGARDRLEHVLLHECAHVRRRDSVGALASIFFRALFWFHPIVWIATARLAVLREIGCDQHVAARLGRGSREYARTLAILARPGLGLSSPGGMGLFHKTSQLVQRLESLAKPSSTHFGWRRALAASLILVVLACGPATEASALSPVGPSQRDQPRAGCLQHRFEVMRMLAAERDARR